MMARAASLAAASRAAALAAASDDEETGSRLRVEARERVSPRSFGESARYSLSYRADARRGAAPTRGKRAAARERDGRREGESEAESESGHEGSSAPDAESRCDSEGSRSDELRDASLIQSAVNARRVGVEKSQSDDDAAAMSQWMSRFGPGFQHTPRSAPIKNVEEDNQKLADEWMRRFGGKLSHTGDLPGRQVGAPEDDAEGEKKRAPELRDRQGKGATVDAEELPTPQPANAPSATPLITSAALSATHPSPQLSSAPLQSPSPALFAAGPLPAPNPTLLSVPGPAPAPLGASVTAPQPTVAQLPENSQTLGGTPVGHAETRQSQPHRQVTDRWANTNAEEQFTWDYCMVFKAGSPKVMVRNDENRKVSQEVLYRISTSQTLARVRRAGLKTKVFRGSSGDRFFCLIGATEKRLEEEAHRVEYELELDAHEVIAHGRAQNLRLFRASHSARFVDEDDLLAGGFRLFGKYDGTKQELRPLYSQPRNEGKYHLGTVFRTADRLKLTLSILEGDIVAGGAGLSINTLVKDPAAALRACFPLHQPRLRERLSRQWLRIQSVFSPPLREIRDYMGEKVAFYFSYLSHYNVWLMLPALIGVVFFMMQLSEGTVDIKAVPIFSMFITLWSSLFLESWRRQEAKLRAQWGMVNFVQRERTRAEFVGAVTRSPIDGTVIRDFSLLRKTLRVMFSYSVISALLMVIVSSVIGVFFLRAVLLEWSPSAGSVMTALINALQIQLSNVGYGRLSARLNDYENHRTDTQYENALIAKNFLFKFVNSYNSLFYVAFLKKHDTSVGGCVNNDCLAELRVQLATIFVSQLVINNSFELLQPILRGYAKRRKFSRSGRRNAVAPAEGASGKSAPERQYDMPSYDPFDDYDELVMQFGFVTMFVTAFPIAPLLALLNNFVEARLDATKCIKLTQRPTPAGIASIGAWYSVLSIVNFISVVTNTAITAFESDVVEGWTKGDYGVKVWLFVLIEHAVVLTKLAIHRFVSDDPGRVREHVLRQQYLVDHLINDIPEKGAGEEASSLSLRDMDAQHMLTDQDLEWERQVIAAHELDSAHVFDGDLDRASRRGHASRSPSPRGEPPSSTGSAKRARDKSAAAESRIDDDALSAAASAAEEGTGSFRDSR